MPSIEENREVWDSWYTWPHSGAEWSALWGSPAAQWHGTILPRIRHFLPAPTILEIAPGMGRWTQFLLASCDRLIGVDLATHCVAACTARFASTEKAQFFLNDGRSLTMVDDESIDFAFSFDSLVHADVDALVAYVAELARTLRPEGIGVLHHSNYGSYRHLQRWAEPVEAVARRAPSRARPLALLFGLGVSAGWRDPDVSAEVFADACQASGLRCIGQELVPWSSGYWLTDCISIVTRPGSRWERPRRVVRNRQFMAEARSVGTYAPIYEPDYDPS